MAVTIDNPISNVIAAALDAFPDLDCDCFFVGELPGGVCGATVFPDDGGRPQVCVRVDLPLEGVLDVLAHELAHVVSGLDGPEDYHSPEWEAAFDAINKAYLVRVMGTENGQAAAGYS